MNRRGFLKRIGQIIGGISVVPSVTKADGFKKIDRLSDLRAKGMCQKEVDALNLPKWAIMGNGYEKGTFEQLFKSAEKQPITKLKQLLIAIDLAESKNWGIRKILVSPAFMAGLTEELEKIRANVVGYHYYYSWQEPMRINGYYLVVNKNLLGDYVLDCDRVYAYFNGIVIQRIESVDIGVPIVSLYG